jgi:hypothetical protein
MEISEPIVACIADLAFKYTGFFFFLPHKSPRFQANYRSYLFIFP